MAFSYYLGAIAAMITKNAGAGVTNAF